MKSARKIKVEYYSKEVLQYLLAAGSVVVAANSPYFVLGIMRKKTLYGVKKKSQKEKNSFAYLKRKSFIETRRIGHDIEIALTPEGKKRAGKYQIDDLMIPKPKKWDGKWRVVIFDISTESNFVRNVFRRKLKEFGFQPIQMSVWVYPFPCVHEIDLLRRFLGADKNQIKVMEVTKMEDDQYLRKRFCV
jgi:CRISPR-associated endonuclease Cas2